MADLLRSSAVWLAGKQKTFTSQSIVYLRGSVSISLLAVKGRTEHRIDNGAGVFTTVTTEDFIVEFDDFSAIGSGNEPLPRDQIIWQSQVYDVVPPDISIPCWQWSDQYRLRLRIHTKHIGDA